MKMMKRYFMFKYLLAAVLFVFLNTVTYGQEKIDKYCVVKSYGKGFEVILNKTGSLFSFKDTTIRLNLNKVNTIKTQPDLLNYMAAMNWTFVSFTEVLSSYTYIFKRVFDKSEIASK